MNMETTPTKTFTITSTRNLEVRAYLMLDLDVENCEDDEDRDEVYDAYAGLSGDLWTDCDYLITPSGYAYSFVCLLIDGHDYIVCQDHDSQEHDTPGLYGFEDLTDDDLQALSNFAQDLVFHNLNKRGYLKELSRDLTFGGPWLKALESLAKSENAYYVGYRGGRGYSYGIYKVSPACLDNSHIEGTV